ncbi:MAG: GntR family transcriptional regulator [Pseudobdellovibrionaceae bacterium]
MNQTPYIRINFEPTKKLNAKSIVDTIKNEIDRGQFPPGSKLPPVRVLELQFGISKNTALAAQPLVSTPKRKRVPSISEAFSSVVIYFHLSSCKSVFVLY